MKYIILFSMSMSLLLANWSCSADSNIQPSGDLKLILSLQKIDSVAKTILVQLSVTNVGEHRLILPRLREEVLKQSIDWGGYALSIENHHGQGFSFSAARPPRYTKKDLLELEPGEGFIVIINIADAFCCLIESSTEGSEEKYLTLAEIDGEYTVIASLFSNNETIPTNLRNVVWKGIRESNSVSFVIPSEEMDEQDGQAGAASSK